MLIHQMIEYNAQNYPALNALRFAGATITYEQFNTRATALAAGLQELGLKPGCRLALLAKNSLEYPLLLLACLKAGITLVPLNYRLAPMELSYILSDSKSEMLVVGDEELLNAAAQSEAVAGIAHRFYCGGAQGDWRGLAELEIDAAKLSPHHGSEQDTVLQLYTSGTTGYPKGVMIGHRQLSDGYIMTNQITPRAQVADSGIIPLPMFHVAGMAATLYWLCNGMTVELMADFIPQQVVDAIISNDRCDIVLVPAMIQAILAFVPNIQDYDFSSLKRITYGASPISLETLQTALKIFKCDFVQGFGMTELSCMVLCLQPSDHERALAGEPNLLRSCGRPLPGAELKIVDEQGNTLAPGETGELLVRSSTTMQGYWQLPEKTAETIVNGWLHTGDAGYLDEDGFFYIRDRVKDMIVSGGENIYPAEVENALFSHPAIQDVAVIGVPDIKFGEAALAVCVLKAGEAVDGNALVEFCKTRLAGYKTPRQYSFVQELPRNPSGKVLKRILREPYWENTERQVG